LVEYYEGVLKIKALFVGAGGLPLATTFKSKFKNISKESDPAEGAAPTNADANSALDSSAAAAAADADAEAADVADTDSAPAADADAALAAAPAAAPAGRRRGCCR
jgi:hypothetical protein